MNTENDAAIAQALQEHEEAARGPPLLIQGRPLVGRRPPAGGPTTSSTTTSSSSTTMAPPTMMSTATTHMCLVPCVLGHDEPTGIAVEMMIDTGAQVSVLSVGLARRLRLMHQLDTRHQGLAAGVGQARILGRLSNVPCSIGHVEFLFHVYVLDTPDPILLLGMDLLRQYKCVVDLERDVLIFGGRQGVEVPLLPPDQLLPSQLFHRQSLQSNCAVM